MSKLSGIAVNSSPADTDYLVGVTAGGVDSRFTFTTLLNWLKGKAAWISAAMVDFTSLTPAAPVQLSGGQSFSTSAAVTGASLTFTADGTHQYEIMFTAPQAIGTAANNRLDLSIIKDGATNLGFCYSVITNSTGGGVPICMRVLDTPTAGSHTYTMNGVMGTGSGTAGFYADGTSKAIFSVRVIR